MWTSARRPYRCCDLKSFVPGPILSAHQAVAYLGQRDELLVSWGAHVKADG